MKNTECTIYIFSNNGKMYQSYRKTGSGWEQKTVSSGAVRPCTAEQLLSHILPSLAFGHVTVRVVPDEDVKFMGKQLRE